MVLTNEQLAGLASPNGYRLGDVHTLEELEGIVATLVPEVQQARARQCGNCRHYGPARGETDDDGECNHLQFMGGIFIKRTWGCNDFSPCD